MDEDSLRPEQCAKMLWLDACVMKVKAGVTSFVCESDEEEKVEDLYNKKGRKKTLMTL